ncbi:cell death abnormality protein 1 [Bactrocera neohumeralis]|uniref:cell death abnormality protein 1 n=1 Tax=Bactrocera neohumeralis TaxID=98809 RepID=UPI0021655E10|nr:cell death abnormality protein 1 [Bactrocera neohumeralis]
MVKLIGWIVWIFIGVFLVLRQAVAMIPEEIMEVACAEDEHCHYYETENVTSSCVHGLCHCYNNQTNVDVTCEPNILHTNNIIGGNCPCKFPHAECHQADYLCYCEDDYVPTIDRRRCIPKQVPLGEPCETDEQCLFSTVFSHCDGSTKTCSCDAGFLRNDSICLSQTKLRAKCDDRMRCSQHGPHKICFPEVGECVCEQGYVSANTSEECLPGRKLHEDCQDASQCYAFMGPGATCEKGKCQCRVEYSIVTRKTKENRYSIALEKICTPLAEVGQYCTLNEHCHNGPEDEDEQLMECDHGECACRFGFKNQVPCSSTASSVNVKNNLLWIILAMTGLQMHALNWEAQRTRSA